MWCCFFLDRSLALCCIQGFARVEEKAESLKKKKRGYQESYIELGFIEAMDKIRAECIFCSEKLANESLKPCKLKRHQTTKHPETVGKPK